MVCLQIDPKSYEWGYALSSVLPFLEIHFTQIEASHFVVLISQFHVIWFK